MGKALRVDLTRRLATVEPLREDWARAYLGGRGLAARYYLAEVGPGVDPLSPRNKLMFFAGPITGTPLPGSTKLALATRSPETGIYLCSNSGGDAGPNLKFSGYDGLIVEGRADSPVFLVIRDSSVEFRDASPLMGLTTSACRDACRGTGAREGVPGASVMCVGPAAERGVVFSCIQVDGRSFGRGGAGAVMASKNLKAVVVKGSGQIPLADPEAVRELARAAAAEARKTRVAHHEYGTPQYTDVMSSLGCYPTRNFTASQFEGVETISARYMVEHYKVRSAACFHCPVGCAQVCEVRSGPFKGVRADPEYETIGTLGGQCGIADMSWILVAHHLADELGLDAMSLGTVVAFAMECFERGLFGQTEALGAGDAPVRFGSGEALANLTQLIAERSGLGSLLSKGFRGIAEERPDTVGLMMHSKWMPFAAYEPRGFHGIGLSYGTSSRGACHNVGGWTIREELLSKTHDRFALAGKGDLVKSIQDTRAYVDSLALCTVLRGSLGFSEHPSGNVLELLTGVGFTPELMQIGERIYTLERVILNSQGISREDDYLPERMAEPLPDGPAAGRKLTREMFDSMLDEYYAARGWDGQGRPTAEALRKQGVV